MKFVVQKLTATSGTATPVPANAVAAGPMVVEAESAEAALAAKGLTAYVAPAKTPSAEVAALRRKYLDATAALCALAGVPYMGKLENTQYDTVATAASSHPQAGVLTATLVYCRACLREIEGAGWWDGITGV